MCLTSKVIYVLLIFFMNENPFSLHIYEAIFLRLISLLHFQRQSVSNRKTTQHLIIILSIVLCVVCISQTCFFRETLDKNDHRSSCAFIKFPTSCNRKRQRRTHFILKICQQAFYVFPQNPLCCCRNIWEIGYLKCQYRCFRFLQSFYQYCKKGK